MKHARSMLLPQSLAILCAVIAGLALGVVLSSRLVPCDDSSRLVPELVPERTHSSVGEELRLLSLVLLKERADDDNDSMLGCGVAVHPALIVTAEHVVDNISTCTVVNRAWLDSDGLVTGTVVLRDKRRGLAIVYLQGLSVGISMNEEPPDIGDSITGYVLAGALSESLSLDPMLQVPGVVIARAEGGRLLVNCTLPDRLAGVPFLDNKHRLVGVYERTLRIDCSDRSSGEAGPAAFGVIRHVDLAWCREEVNPIVESLVKALPSWFQPMLVPWLPVENGMR